MTTSKEPFFPKDIAEGVEVIYRMSIRTKSGKVIRRPCGRPFKIVIGREKQG